MGSQLAVPESHLSSPASDSRVQTGSLRAALRVKTTVVVGFIAGLLLCPKLWLSARFYPQIRVIHGLPNISAPADYIVYGALLLLLFAMAFAARPRIYIFSFVTLLALYSLWDQTRWQPWIYQYWLFLIALGCSSWKAEDARGREDALNICRLIVVFTYFYSGLQKFNHRFIVEGFAWVLNTIKVHFFYAQYLGYVAAAIEVSIGLCLLTRRFRRLGVVNAVIMHLFILYSFGPLGRNWNSVVWPWNIVMIVLVILLFWSTDARATAARVLWQNQFAYQKIALVLVAVLPALSPFGLWPSDLSSALYTGNLTDANILMSEQAKNALPPAMQRYVEHVPGLYGIDVQSWAFGEMNVPPYAEIQSFNSAGATVCGLTHNSPDVVLLGHEKNTVLGPGREIRNTCLGTLVAPAL